MLLLANTFEKVVFVGVFGDEVFWVNNSGIAFCNGLRLVFDGVKLKDSEKIGKILRVGEYICVLETKGRLIAIIHYKTKQQVIDANLLYSDQYFCWGKYLYNNRLLLRKKSQTGNSLLAYDPLNNSFENVLLDVAKYARYDFYDNQTLLYVRKETIVNGRQVDGLSGISFQDGQEEWLFDDLRDLGGNSVVGEMHENVIHVWGIVNGLLWIYLAHGRIVGLEPNTGVCKKSIEVNDIDLSCFDSSETEFKGAHGYTPIFIEKESKVIFLYSTIYFEIDLTLDKPLRVCYNVSKNFKEKGLICGGHVSANARYVFFNESMSGTIGVFDRKEKIIVWVGQLEYYYAHAGSVRQLLAAEDYLYIHDSNRNLLVFALS